MALPMLHPVNNTGVTPPPAFTMLEVAKQPAALIRRETVSMTSKLDVTVAVNINSGTVAVTPTGNPTRQNVQALTPVAIRAAALAPDLTLVLDLRKLSGAEPGALQFLESCRPAGTRLLGPDTPHTRSAKTHGKRSQRAAHLHGATA